MPFSWPTFEQALYRITRLRRVIFTSVILAGLVLLLVGALDPTTLPMQRAASILLIVSTVIIAHVVLFPNVPLEALSLSISISGFMAAVPLLSVLGNFAPMPYRDAALVLLIGMGMLLVIVVMLVAQFLIEAIIYVGPVVHFRLKTHLDVPFAAFVASRQFGLRPDTRRGRVMTGSADDKGFFDVAVVSQHDLDPEDPTQPMVVKLDAKVLKSDVSNHEVMLVLADGAVTVTSYRFVAKDDGCQVKITEIPGDFTLGMHAVFWLMDQQTDNLVEVAELLQGGPSCANGLSHAVSLLSIAGMILSPRQPLLD
ncbi:hypothetical protein CLV80_10198 [Yoonia maritima]|uniref:Uncharacterized protein n=1 Tax=Yoonia maritima TaxID=1435347 RepID=A0A2T0W467_9RHOB|nr:hypothetical protein [Yoonia maritima]PRY80247.1 hypothetical protein CLV80_10198 [Yoonia maritima]